MSARAPQSNRKLKPDGAQADAARRLLQWYDIHRRDLPWRARSGETPDPYRVWLSEIMLQQTTVKTVGPYFEDFIRRWPHIAALAQAPKEEVLSAWAGLGYYTRAHNLHACAKMVAGELNGHFPQNERDLLALPGIGPYTAAAIAAIAFDRRAAPVDGNIERVMARLLRIETPMPAAKTEIRARLEAYVPQTRPGDFIQALMDLGAGICTPRAPTCDRCPLEGLCEAKARGLAEGLPRKAPRRAQATRYGNAFVLEDGEGRILLRRRPAKGLLGGMMETPGSAWTAEPPARADDGAPIIARWQIVPGRVAHVFTHFRLELTVLRAAIGQKPEIEGMWVAPAALAEAALPTLFAKVIAHARG